MIGAGTQLVVGTVDDVFVVEGVTIASTGSKGLINSGSDQSVNVQGTVVAVGNAIDLGVSTSTGQHLTIGANGYAGSSAAATHAAVLMQGFDHLAALHTSEDTSTRRRATAHGGRRRQPEGP